MANVLWNLVQNEDLEILRYCCLTISHQGLDFFFNGYFVLFYKKQGFFSGVAKLSLSLLSVTVGLVVIPEFWLSCTSRRSALRGFSHSTSVTSYTNSWSVSRL